MVINKRRDFLQTLGGAVAGLFIPAAAIKSSFDPSAIYRHAMIVPCGRNFKADSQMCSYVIRFLTLYAKRSIPPGHTLHFYHASFDFDNKHCISYEYSPNNTVHTHMDFLKSTST